MPVSMRTMSIRLLVAAIASAVSLMLVAPSSATAASQPEREVSEQVAAAPGPIDFSCGFTVGRAWAAGSGRISFNAWVRCNTPILTVRTVALELKRNGAHVIYTSMRCGPLRDDGDLWSCNTATTTLPRGTFTGGLADWCVDADVYWSMNARNDMDSVTDCYRFRV